MAGVADSTSATTQPGYIVVRVQSVLNQERYDEYRRHTPDLLARHGARYIVKGCAEEVAEGTAPERFTIIEFPSVEAIHRFWNSPEYAEIRALREDAVILKIGFVAGQPRPTASRH